MIKARSFGVELETGRFTTKCKEQEDILIGSNKCRNCKYNQGTDWEKFKVMYTKINEEEESGDIS